MAKQKKAVIDARTTKLKALGYEVVPNSQGAYQTIREVDRLTVERKDIEYMTDPEWSVVLVKLEADHTKHLEVTPAEHIEPEAAPVTNLQELVIRVEKEAETGIATFDANKATLAEWKKKYAHLKFTSLEDTENNNLIIEGWRTARTSRLALEKREDFLKAPFIAASKKIGGVAAEYYVLLAEIEKPLKDQRDAIEAAKEEEKNKAALAAEAEGKRRVDVLKENGMTFDGSFYVIGETISVDYSTVKAMPVEDFDKFLGKVAAEKTRLDDLAADELKQLKANRVSSRSEMLISIGMVTINGGDAYGTTLLPGVTVMIDCLTDEPDDVFMKLFSSLSGRINDAKNKAKEEEDKAAKERTLKTRTRLLLSIGLERVDWIPGTTQTGFYFKNDFVECKLTLPDLEAKDDGQFDDYLDIVQTEITEAKFKLLKKEEDDRKAQQLAQDRGQQLVALGMTRAPQQSCFIFNLPDAKTQCSVAYGELTGQSPETWEATINDVTATIAAIKEEQKAFEDKAAKDKKDKEDKDNADKLIFQERQYKLVNLGMVIVGNKFIVKNEFSDFAAISIEEVKAIDEDSWPRRLMDVTQDVEDVKAKTKFKRQKAIDDAEALKPQVTKAREYLASILDIPFPEVTEDKLDAIMSIFKEELFNAMNKTNKALEQVK